MYFFFSGPDCLYTLQFLKLKINFLFQFRTTFTNLFLCLYKAVFVLRVKIQKHIYILHSTHFLSHQTFDFLLFKISFNSCMAANSSCHRVSSFGKQFVTHIVTQSPPTRSLSAVAPAFRYNFPPFLGICHGLISLLSLFYCSWNMITWLLVIFCFIN